MPFLLPPTPRPQATAEERSASLQKQLAATVTAASRAQGELKQHLAAAQHRITELEEAAAAAEAAAEVAQQEALAARHEAATAKREAAAAKAQVPVPESGSKGPQVAVTALPRPAAAAAPRASASRGAPLLVSVSRWVLAASAVALLGTAGASVAARRSGQAGGAAMQNKKHWARPTKVAGAQEVTPAGDAQAHPAPAAEAFLKATP